MLREVNSIPTFGDIGTDVAQLQRALVEKGFKISVDGVFGNETKKAISDFQKNNTLPGSGIVGPKTLSRLDLKMLGNNDLPEWYKIAKEFEGKKETDAAFQNKLNPFWAKAGLPQYKGLVGSARAWCALFILANLSWAGLSYKKGNASAISWDNFGQKIEWKMNGIPQGAIVRINANADCKSYKGNHVTFANGFCSSADLLKQGATFSGLGGNQGNMVKVSNYSVSKICSVRWPLEETIPQPVIASKNCNGTSTDSSESTR